MSKNERSIYTEVALQVAEDIRRFREDFRAGVPASFMREKMTPGQFKAQYGIGIREWDALRAKHGDDVAQQTVDMLRGAQVPPQEVTPDA